MWTIRQINKIFPVWIAWFFIILDLIWEFPQTLAGAVVKLVFLKCGSQEVDTGKLGKCLIQNWNISGGVSLGWFQFTPRNAGKDYCAHEVGHSVQSVILGPLYLLIIGLPSILWAGGVIPRNGRGYYEFFSERWSNRISGAYGG